MNSLADLVSAIKKAALDAFDNSDPTAVMVGDVISESPLQIMIEQRLTIEQEQLILTRNVTDYTVQATFNMNTGSSESHRHSVSGTHPMTIRNGLHDGDTVLLIRQSGGQKFIVLDRVVV